MSPDDQRLLVGAEQTDPETRPALQRDVSIDDEVLDREVARRIAATVRGESQALFKNVYVCVIGRPAFAFGRLVNWPKK